MRYLQPHVTMKTAFSIWIQRLDRKGLFIEPAVEDHEFWSQFQSKQYTDILPNSPTYYALKKWNISLLGQPVHTPDSILKDISFSK